MWYYGIIASSQGVGFIVFLFFITHCIECIGEITLFKFLVPTLPSALMKRRVSKSKDLSSLYRRKQLLVRNLYDAMRLDKCASRVADDS